MVALSPAFNPPILKGLKVHSDNPFRFDFILDKGSNNVIPAKAGIQKLIKYFLASLTIPEKDLWVNLSPYEKNRIVPESFGKTEMGRDLLAEDYILKQITASLIYPEGDTGKKFWKRIYEESAQKFGTTDIPVNTFNKVWIVPDKAVVYENAKAGTAYVVESKLKVMLEQDYLSLSRHVIPAKTGIQSLGSQILRAIVIPELAKEVNSGRNFSQLRQVYNSLILATWYKKKIKDSILSQVYANKNKIVGILSSPNALVGDPQQIYQRYLQAFKKGAYNFIKEETDPATLQPIPRKYFSGGANLWNINSAMITTDRFQQSQAQREWLGLTVDLRPNAAMRAVFLSENESNILENLLKLAVGDGQTRPDIEQLKLFIWKQLIRGEKSLWEVTGKQKVPKAKQIFDLFFTYLADHPELAYTAHNNFHRIISVHFDGQELARLRQMNLSVWENLPEAGLEILGFTAADVLDIVEKVGPPGGRGGLDHVLVDLNYFDTQLRIAERAFERQGKDFGQWLVSMSDDRDQRRNVFFIIRCIKLLEHRHAQYYLINPALREFAKKPSPLEDRMQAFRETIAWPILQYIRGELSTAEALVDFSQEYRKAVGQLIEDYVENREDIYDLDRLQVGDIVELKAGLGRVYAAFMGVERPWGHKEYRFLELDSVDQSSVQGDVLVLRGKAQHFLNLQRLKFKPGAFGEIRAKAKDIRDVVFENAKPKRGVMPPVSLTRDQRQELRDLFKAWQALKYPKKLWLEGLLDRKTDPIILAQFFMFALMDEDFEVRRRVVELNNGIPTFYRGQVLLPVDFLLQHVERPWLSIDLYTSIMGKRPFTPEKEREALRDKRLALLVLFLVEFRRRYAFKRTEPELIAYLDEIKNHLASPISTQGLLKASGQAKLYVEQAVEDHRISLLGDRSPLSFWEVFLIERARDRVLTKMFPGKLTTYHFVQEKYVPLLLNADIVSWSEPDFSHLLVSTVSAIDHEVADMHIPVVTPDIDHLPSVHRGDEITINIVYKPISKGLIFHAKANDWQSPLSEEHNFPYLTSEQRQKATKDHNQVYNIPLTQISSSKYTISLRAGLEREMNFVILDNGEGISGFNHILHVLPLADTAMTTRAEAEFVKPNAAMLRNDDNQSLYGLNGEQLIAWFGRNMRRLEILGLDHHTILTRITQRLQTALLEGEISTGTFRQHFFRYQDLLIPAFPFDLSGQIEKDKIKSPEGLPAIAAQMTQNHGGKVQVIGMAGEGGAGKTATAETLAQFLIKKGLRVGVVGLDGYFKPRELRHQQNLIGMAQIDMSRLAGDVQNFKNGKKFYPPLYIPRTGQYVASPDPIDPAKIDVLIFDGNWTFILEPLKELLTYKVYVDWPVRDRFRYLIERNMSVRKYSREYAVWQAVNSLIKERSLIRKQAKMADIIIQNQAMITADKSMTDIDQMFEDEDLRLSSTDIRFLKTIHGTVVAGKNNKRYRFDYGFGNSAFMKRFITTHKLDVFIIKEIDGNGNVIPGREKVGSVSIFPLDQGRYSDGLRLGFLHFDLYDNNDIRQGIFSGFLQKLHTEYLKVETIKEENTLVYMAERFLLKGTIAQIMESKPQDRPRIFAKKLSVFKVSVLNEAFKNSPMGQALVKAGFHEFHVIFGKEGMEMHVEAWINKAMSADDNLAMRSKIQKTGGIDLTSDQGLSIQNQGQAVKFYIDPSKLAELQNTPGFVPIIINVQPVTDLRLWLGITSAK